VHRELRRKVSAWNLNSSQKPQPEKSLHLGPAPLIREIQVLIYWRQAGVIVLGERLLHEGLGSVKPEVTSTCQACGTRIPAGLDFCPVCALVRAGSHDSAPSEGLNPVSNSERSSAETEPSSIVRRLENYEVMLDRDGQPIELGRGAMGITYKGFDVDLRFPVTLKVISEKYVGDESARLRFLREARAAAKVRHTNVASVLHLGRTGSGYFYAMEFVEGETLESLIKRSGRLEVGLALEITSQVAAGLGAVHKHNLVHRDLKPSNIMVSLEEGGGIIAKIIDLGLAKGASEFGSASEISTPGAFAGTPAFASPEQFAGLGADIRSDLYSLGVTLWEMLVGQVPFRGSPSELMHEHQHASVPLEQLKGLPQPVVVLLEVMLEKDPTQRFQSPGQLQRALTKTRGTIASGLRLTQDELRSAGEPVAARSAKAKPKNQPIRWLLGAASCLAIVLITWLFSSGHLGLFSQRVTAAAPTEKSIAVLPFDNISPNKEGTYFADGVQDEILNNLAKIAQLKVICRTSVMQYRADAKRDLRQIAMALGVANVLEGTVRRDGKHVRVSTELVDARDGTTIWADSYDRDLNDIFAIQSEIAQAVASRLSARLSPEERKDIEQKPTDNLEAYDFYLQAKRLLRANYWAFPSSEKEIYPKIISLLEEAIQKDREFALAYCLIGEIHAMLYVDQIDHTPERRALGEVAVNEALRLRADLPEAHLAKAFDLYACDRDFERARLQLAIAARSLPNDAELLVLWAFIDQRQGRWEQAVSTLERATTLDPRNPELLGGLADAYSALRRYRDAERIIDRAIELEPDQPAFLIPKAMAPFAEKADVKEARAACEAFSPSVKDDPVVAFYRVYLAACARDFAAAKGILSESPNQEIWYVKALVPRRMVMLFVEFLQGNHPTTQEFGAAREELYRRVQADPSNPFLMTGLALGDLALGRKQESIREGQRAMEMRPMSEDAVDGPTIATLVAIIYAWTNQPDTAFEQLNIVAKMPGWHLSYGNLKTDPAWDPLRKDQRFDKLSAELAPRD
jgi:serine/threonine protein kinase/Flp pilus assembly protein TadD